MEYHRASSAVMMLASLDVRSAHRTAMLPNSMTTMAMSSTRKQPAGSLVLEEHPDRGLRPTHAPQEAPDADDAQDPGDAQHGHDAHQVQPAPAAHEVGAIVLGDTQPAHEVDGEDDDEEEVHDRDDLVDVRVPEEDGQHQVGDREQRAPQDEDLPGHGEEDLPIGRLLLPRDTGSGRCLPSSPAAMIGGGPAVHGTQFPHDRGSTLLIRAGGRPPHSGRPTI